MTELLVEPWLYATGVVLTALILRRRLRLWGFGFGVEANEPAPPRQRKKPGK